MFTRVGSCNNLISLAWKVWFPLDKWENEVQKSSLTCLIYQSRDVKADVWFQPSLVFALDLPLTKHWPRHKCRRHVCLHSGKPTLVSLGEPGTGCAASLLYIERRPESVWTAVLGLQKGVPVEESPEEAAWAEQSGMHKEHEGNQKCHAISIIYTELYILNFIYWNNSSKPRPLLPHTWVNSPCFHEALKASTAIAVITQIDRLMLTKHLTQLQCWENCFRTCVWCSSYRRCLCTQQVSLWFRTSVSFPLAKWCLGDWLCVSSPSSQVSEMQLPPFCSAKSSPGSSQC